MYENEYLEKLKTWYLKSRKFIKNSIFKNNYYENPKSTLLKPVFTSEKDVLTALRIYSKNKNNTKLRKMIENHFNILIVHVSVYQLKKYYRICDNIQDYISFNGEIFIRCLNRYNPDMMANFTTYFIDSANKNIRNRLLDIYDPNLTFNRNVRTRFEYVKKMIDEYYYSDYNKIWNDFDKKEFKKTFNFDKINFFELLNRTYISLSDPLTHYIDNNSHDNYESCIAEKINREEIYINKCLIESLCEYLRKQVGYRDYDIWENYYVVNKGITYEDLARKYNITRERIRQILNKCNDIIKQSELCKDIICE